MKRLLLGSLTALAVTAPALAQQAPMAKQPLAHTPSQMSEVNGATTGLGSSHRFKTMEAAQNHCPGDTIVWGSGDSQTYYLPGSLPFGHTPHGFYACKMEASDAGFKPANAN
ncbi:MAG: hypothetical protein B7Z80_14630 [Rhodospirillales bacterium 20-64-7]|nr:MAG: hypothetical protein B7Z80_14630 [Rhodospirillales bacterium 20-64-7]